MSKDSKWFNERGYFTGKSAKHVADAICELAGYPRNRLDVVKTDHALHIFFVYSNQLYRLDVSCHVIYALTKEDLRPTIEALEEYYL